MTQTVLLGNLMAEKGYIRGPFGSALRRPEMKKEGIPVYEQQNAIYNHRDFRFFIDDQKYSELKRFTVKPGDLLISCSGTLGKITIIRPEDKVGIISQALLILRVDQKKVLPEYLYYFLTSAQGQYLLLGASHGSVQANIAKRAVVEAIEVSLPSLPEQQEIVNMLGAIDEKIELNRRMNETLEQVGQALFRHYFIINPEAEKWEVGQLDDLFKVTMGQSPPGSSYNENGEGITFYQGRAEFGIRFPNKRLSTVDPKRLAKKGDTLLSVRAPVGDINQATEDCCVGRGVAAISSKTGQTSFCYYSCKNLQVRFAEYNSEGTVFGAINGKQLKSLKIKLPTDDVVEKFEQQTIKIDEQIFNNSHQIQTLTALRDTLLPRLISGKTSIVNEYE